MMGVWLLSTLSDEAETPEAERQVYHGSQSSTGEHVPRSETMANNDKGSTH